MSLYRLLQPLCGRRTVLSQTNLDILIDSPHQGLTIHGSPKELYLDNAKVYHSDALRSACYNLGIKLIHRPPRDPAPGGLVERFFGTSQTQFESEVRSGDIITLDAINQAFSAYLAVVYHARIHPKPINLQTTLRRGVYRHPTRRYGRRSCLLHETHPQNR
ncbi:MAG: DDE-type integrase/transposase/recombinase [Planctomycetia bacterium]|nr:DDE-type integrase/transposase/recombinase [Planctomycetia bacterium]